MNVLYSEQSTLMIISFDEESASPRTMDAIKQIKTYAEKECYLGGLSAVSEDVKDLTQQEMPIYIVIAVALVVLVLYLGLSSNLAPFIFVLGIVFPVAYNMGSNVLLGEVSYITKALAVVL